MLEIKINRKEIKISVEGLGYKVEKESLWNWENPSEVGAKSHSARKQEGKSKIEDLSRKFNTQMPFTEVKDVRFQNEKLLKCSTQWMK